MTALNRDRNTPERTGKDFGHPVLGNVKIYAGALVVLSATGFAAPGSTALALIAVGRAAEEVDNTGGADGALTVRVERGTFQWGNDASINRTHIGKTAYIVDDQTVAATDGAGTRSAAGLIVDVDADGVWVKI
jgi:hypothetical protein